MKVYEFAVVQFLEISLLHDIFNYLSIINTIIYNIELFFIGEVICKYRSMITQSSLFIPFFTSSLRNETFTRYFRETLIFLRSIF